MSVTGSSISMQPPAGFTPATKFAGFENLETHCSITVIDFPADAYEEISAEFLTLEAARQSFAQQQVDVDAHQFLTIDGVDTPFVEGTQGFAGKTVTKYFVLLRGESTVLVVFNIFDTSVTTRDDVINSVTSIELRAAASIEEQLLGLPFTVSAAEPFRFSQVMGGVSAILSTADEPVANGEDPIIVVSYSMRPADTSNLSRLSTALLNSTDGFETAAPFNEESVITPAGRAWRCEIEQDGRRCIQYVWATDDSNYLRLMAVGSPGALNAVQQEVSEVVNSVRLKT